MDEFNSIEDYADMGEVGSKEAQSIASGTSPMTADKRANIYDFIHAFEEKKRKKKKPKEEKNDTLTELSPLVEFMKTEVCA